MRLTIPAHGARAREAAAIMYWTGLDAVLGFDGDAEDCDRTHIGAYGFYDAGCVGPSEPLIPTTDLDDARERARKAFDLVRPELAGAYALGWLAGVALVFCCGEVRW